MRRCPVCYTYTFSDRCPKCGNPTSIPHPPKFSPDDKYLELRVKRGQ
ncbi:MAG: RNA-protein complex protein Nop10 [Nitrososphaerota archaeon]